MTKAVLNDYKNHIISLLKLNKLNIIFNNLKEKLLSLSKEGLICEDVVEKYI